GISDATAAETAAFPRGPRPGRLPSTSYSPRNRPPGLAKRKDPLMMGWSSCTMKRHALVWRLSAGLLAMSATVLVAIPGANAATADRAPVTTVQSAAPPVQSCNDAYDQTGVGGAGIGQIRAGEKGL